MGYDEHIYRVKKEDITMMENIGAENPFGCAKHEEVYWSHESIIRDYYDFHNRYIEQIERYELDLYEIENILIFASYQLLKMLNPMDILGTEFDEFAFENYRLAVTHLKELIKEYNNDEYVYYFEYC